MARSGTGVWRPWRRPAARKAVIVAVLLVVWELVTRWAASPLLQNRFEMNTDLVFAGLLTVILIGLLVENLFFKWLERKTVLRWDMSAAH